jgi:D-alanyl-D-alanine carboxypeptidase
MLRARVGAARGLRLSILALGAVFAFTTLGSDPADARRYRKRSHQIHTRAYHPPYAAIVVDANSGQVLHAANADALRHPASLTKIMTLYLLFEQIEAGKLKLDSQLDVSEHASVQAPTKLGLRPGQTLRVEDGIKALVTKSANDAAVVIAEAIAGDEEAFARLMTRKARALGMSRTVYTNASGLPDEDQLTTARDQATLGRAIQERFPRYYRYFATAAFVYRGHAIRNHNRLLGRVDGVDGIKTGYTRDSGFNLTTSMRRGNRHIVAVVLGGASGAARDARMRNLIEHHIVTASTQRTVAKIAEAPAAAPAVAPPKAAEPKIAELPKIAEPKPMRTDSVPIVTAPPAPAEKPLAAFRPAPGSNEPIKPVAVKTITVKAGAIQTAALAPLIAAVPHATAAPSHFAKAVPPIVTVRETDTALPPTASALAPVAPRPGILGVLPVPAEPTDAVYDVASAPTPAPAAPPAATRPLRPGEWIIQIGAYPEEAKAQERLREARTLAGRILARADPFTEKVVKGTQELYRARFAGFDQASAEAACKYFKRNDIACMVVKN